MQLSAASLVALTLSLGALIGCALTSCTSVQAPAPAPEKRVAARDGLSIAYEERGTGAPLLVFVHGWCGERAFWRGTMEALAPRHHVLALDLAGHGASQGMRTDWTLAALAEDVVAVVDASGAEDVILIGHSMGAPVALLAAAHLRPRVRGVIGVDSLHRADFAYPPGFLQHAARELEADFPRALASSIRAVVPAKAEPGLVDWIEARAAHTERAAAIGILRGLNGFELAPALAGAGVPVRVINAAGSEPATDVEGNRAVCDYDALLMDGVGHFPMLERPDEFVPLLEHWIDALSLRKGPEPR